MTFSLKFFPVKDLIFSVIPTVGTYFGYLQGVSPEILPNKFYAIGIGLITSLILAIIFYRENVKSYKKSLAELLATGYFMNFTGRLGKLLKSKVPINFTYKDGSIKSFDAKDIFVEIGIPGSLQALTRYSNSVESLSEILYVTDATQSEPFWLRGNVEENTLMIYEFPRTLFSLAGYLKTESGDMKKAEKKSKKIYGYFEKKIEELRILNGSQLPMDKFEFKHV
ncbi:MAG: hypothetical protein HKN52_07435 [Eudoraea sp.]|nr:hypothetical protein [Eudoraea sp.]